MSSDLKPLVAGTNGIADMDFAALEARLLVHHVLHGDALIPSIPTDAFDLVPGDSAREDARVLARVFEAFKAPVLDLPRKPPKPKALTPRAQSKKFRPR